MVEQSSQGTGLPSIPRMLAIYRIERLVNPQKDAADHCHYELLGLTIEAEPVCEVGIEN